MSSLKLFIYKPAIAIHRFIGVRIIRCFLNFVIKNVFTVSFPLLGITITLYTIQIHRYVAHTLLVSIIDCV